MLNYNKDSIDFYIDYINRELYKSKFTLTKAADFNKLTFLHKVNRSSYWFPADAGRKSWEEDNKLRSKKQFSKNSTYNFESFKFLSSFEIFINSKFDMTASKIIKTPVFLNYISLLNEFVRKQEKKKNTQDVRMYSVDTWKYRRYNTYSSLKYYYNFEPHRNLIRLRKFNFLAVYTWFPSKRWLFTYRNMRNFYLKWRKTQKFEFRFFRARGMSLRYWAKQQLQYNYLNTNSSDFLSDPYSSNIFAPSQLAPTKLDFHFLFGSPKYDFLHAGFAYWLFDQITENSKRFSLPSYFSNTYGSNQVSNSSKYKYLKNFFSYSSPKHAHAFYVKLNSAYGGWDELRNYFSFFKPAYWNLKKGLDSYPHEHWGWEDVLWWEDHVPLFFSRFSGKRRQERFADLDITDSADFNWFYKSWFHEEIFTELHASYYRTYYNIDYLTPGWRISTDFPKRRMGHFDPKWQERLQEYVIYPYMNIFYPSTKRYYIDYNHHPDYVDSRSFMVLNFAWKMSTLSPFIYKFRPKFRKVLRGVGELVNPLDKFKPSFNLLSSNYNFINFFPVFNPSFRMQNILNEYLDNLVFLVNFFTQSHRPISLKVTSLEYVFSYLCNICVIYVDKATFMSSINKKQVISYADLFFVVEGLMFITSNELLFHKERVIAEYIAFKRFYSLLISEQGNMK
jgi:hypothetical protein